MTVNGSPILYKQATAIQRYYLKNGKGDHQRIQWSLENTKRQKL